MRLKKLVLLSLLAVSTGVANGQEGPIDAQKPMGGDRDAHGCIGSAGYKWSAIKNTCIRVWEAGVRLYPIEGGALVDYLVWPDDKKSVEVFMIKGDPFIMKMDKPNSYSYKTFTLATGNGTQLKENGKLIASDKKAGPGATPATAQLSVDILSVEGQPGRVTFSQKGKTIFYYDEQTSKGMIKINGTEYPTNAYKFHTDSYTITGDGIKITAPKCKYKKNNGEDCMYGKFSAVTVQLAEQTLTLKGVEVQDCPKY